MGDASVVVVTPYQNTSFGTWLRGPEVERRINRLRANAIHAFDTGRRVAFPYAPITTSKSYIQQSDYRFGMKTFTELRNAQSVAIAY